MSNIDDCEINSRKVLKILGRESPSLKAVESTVKLMIWRDDAKSIVDEILKNVLMMRFVSEDKKCEAIDFINLKKSKSKARSQINLRVCNICKSSKNNIAFVSQTKIINGIERQVLTDCYDCVALYSLETNTILKKHGSISKTKRHDVYRDKEIILKLHKGGMFQKEIALRYNCGKTLIYRIIKGE